MTVKLMIGMEFTYEPPPDATPDEVTEFFGDVMDHLIDLGVEDAGIGLDTGQRLATITAAGAGDNEGEALNAALSALRTAIHAVGGATPGWPTELRWTEITSVPIDPLPQPEPRAEELVAS